MASPQIPLVDTHAYACTSLLLRATIILLPPQLKILYETVVGVAEVMKLQRLDGRTLISLKFPVLAHSRSEDMAHARYQ